MTKAIPTLVASALLASLTLGACQGSNEPDPADAALAEAEAKKKAAIDSIKQRKAKREAEQAAKKKAAEEKTALVDSVSILPKKLPKKLKKACDAAASAQDTFMLKYFMKSEEKKAQWEQAKTTQLGMAKKECMKHNIKVAACQHNALTTAPEALKKELPTMLRRCIEKFSDGGEAKVAAK
ncbi:MAG: hypothetical protein V3V08_03955 [Nannocystaceae bacterium]